MNKIIICGFPHCGTSILKSIIGHIDEVDEIVNETKRINKESEKEFVLCKWPFTLDDFFNDAYKDYIKIFIIRNPIFVFSSLNKRFTYKIPDDHSMDVYLKTLEKFIYFKKNPTKNVYTIRYEELFQNNFKNLKNILDNIGLKYTDDIFDNSKYYNRLFLRINLKDYKPPNTNNEEYRTWQINQPFVSNNDISKLDLTEEQKVRLLNDKNILSVYSGLKGFKFPKPKN